MTTCLTLVPQQMLEDAEEPELPEGDQADVEAGMKSIFEGIESIGEDGMKEMLGKAAEVSEADMGKFREEMIENFLTVGEREHFR